MILAAGFMRDEASAAEAVRIGCDSTKSKAYGMRQEKGTENVSERFLPEKGKSHIHEMKNGAGLGKDCAVLCAEPRTEIERDLQMERRTAGADQDIVVSKWIGLEGTARLAGENYERLRQRFPARMIDEAAAFDRYLSVIPEAATAMKSGVCGIQVVSRGGIFAGLWEMAEEAGVGLEADLRKIPVRQETIEICEVFGENPYELSSGGCLIMTTEDGNALVTALLREGIPAVVIGRTTRGNDRVLYNQGRKSYLNKPRG